MLGGPAALVMVGLLIVLVALIGIVIIPARTERSDETGRKVYAKFLLVVVFLFIFVGIFSAFGVARSLTSLIGRTSACSVPAGMPQPSGSGSFSQGMMSNGPSAQVFACASGGGLRISPAFGVGVPRGPATNGERAARGAVLFGLLLFISLVVLWIHGHSAVRLFDSDEVRRGPPGRVLDAYLFSTSFIALVVFVLAAVSAAYSVFALIGPGAFGAAGRGSAAQQLISDGILAVLADVILWWHVREAWKIHAAPASGAPADNE